MVDQALGFGVHEVTKADLEERAMREARRPDDPGEMTDFDRRILGYQRFARLDFPIAGNRFQIRRCLQQIKAFVEMAEAATRRSDMSDCCSATVVVRATDPSIRSAEAPAASHARACSGDAE